MPRVLMNFQFRDGWWAHFIEADCKTIIGERTRYIHFATLDELRAFVLRATPDDIEEFDRNARRWSRGSLFCTLTEEQYAKLK